MGGNKYALQSGRVSNPSQGDWFQSQSRASRKMDHRVFILLGLIIPAASSTQYNNLALLGKATQSSLVGYPYSAFGHAYNAIDGNPNSNYHDGSCSHTSTQNNPWWRVDLLYKYKITSITITNRGDCCANRINGAEIRVGNSLYNNGNSNTRVAVVSSILPGKSVTFKLSNISGRYVNVILPGYNRILTLCEVEVYGY
ncbi:fucolectin [Astyanax mexicanus]|uniref:fucolectin n=1 Tax=Astyanax mexicanus TaxID=7994 RepID=UPI0020CB3964|nr:fucolectin [Astyanax mexicanus]